MQHPLAQVEARLTPRLQLRSCVRRSPRDLRGEERPTGRGASLRRRYQPLAALEGRPLTPHVPDPDEPRRVRADCAVPLSSSTPCSTRGAFRQQVFPAPARASQETRHRCPGPGTAGSASGATPSSLARRWLVRARFRGSSPRDRPDRRRLSTSAITAVLQHSCGGIVHPAVRKGSFLPARSYGQRCTSRCNAGRAVSGQGPPRALGPRQRLLVR